MNHYGMFTDMGNGLVGCIVQMALEFELSDQAVLRTLAALAEDEAYSEATDTAVRESVLNVIQGARRASFNYELDAGENFVA